VIKVSKILRILGKRGRVTILCPIRKEMGFSYNDILSFTSTEEGTVVIKIEKLCGNCKEKDEEIDLMAFLNTLNQSEMLKAITFLSSKWAEIRGEK